MIKTRIGSEPIPCDRCSQPVTDPWVRWELSDGLILNFCVPCCDLVSRGLFNNVQTILDLRGSQERRPGKRVPMSQYRPSFRQNRNIR